MTEIIVVLDNIRSSHNVGSILRTCDGLGVSKLIACGVTPYPAVEGDTRLAHIVKRADKQIKKTSLGAEDTVAITHTPDTADCVSTLMSQGFQIWAIEQSGQSEYLSSITSLPPKLALVFGNEVEGVDMSLNFDKSVEIKMLGKKESLNVSTTVGIVLYKLKSLGDIL